MTTKDRHNKEKRKIYNKIYYERHKKRILEATKKYAQDHPLSTIMVPPEVHNLAKAKAKDRNISISEYVTSLILNAENAHTKKDEKWILKHK